MTAVGKVMKICGDRVTVSVKRADSCSGDCSACGGCAGRTAEVEARCAIAVETGDEVEIATSSRYVYIGLVAVFLLPVLLPIAGYVAFAGICITAAYAAAVILFVCAVTGIVILSKSRGFLDKATPEVIRRVNKK